MAAKKSLQDALLNLNLQVLAEERKFRHRTSQLVARHNEKVTADILDTLLKGTPRELEERVADLLRKMKYSSVRLIGGKGDGGVDILATEMDLLGRPRVVAVQVKRHSAPLDRGWVDELLGTISRRQYQASSGVLVTTSSFTKEAQRVAANQPITLFDGRDLVRMLAENKILLQVGPAGELQELSEETSKHIPSVLAEVIPPWLDAIEKKHPEISPEKISDALIREPEIISNSLKEHIGELCRLAEQGMPPFTEKP